MALSKVNFNSLNLTPTASKTVVFNSNNNGIEAGDVGGSMVLISSQTASSSSSIDFTSGIDSTYKEYIFKYINCHASADDVIFSFQADTGTNTNYNLTVTSSFFSARHGEDGSNGNLNYIANRDQAQGTSDIKLHYDTGNQTASECVSGTLHLFDPSSSTFVKHFISTSNDSGYTSTGASQNNFVAGYFNTTTAITRVRFKMTSGNIDSGTIKMYGVL